MSDKTPITSAIRFLNEKKIYYSTHLYEYEEKGGTKLSAEKLGVDEHVVVKTIVLEDEKRNPLIVLMHGDMEISAKKLARTLNVKSISPCSPDVVLKHTGYLVGGCSPFGTKKRLPVYIEKSILDLNIIYINGGKRGFLVSLNPKVLLETLNPTIVEVGIK
jgi:Cys-tRNA(Pro) deacylase